MFKAVECAMIIADGLEMWVAAVTPNLGSSMGLWRSPTSLTGHVDWPGQTLPMVHIHGVDTLILSSVHGSIIIALDGHTQNVKVKAPRRVKLFPPS